MFLALGFNKKKYKKYKFVQIKMIIKLSRDLFQKYNKFVIKYPLIGMSVTSGKQ